MVPKSRKGAPYLPLLFLGRALSCCVFPGAWPVTSSPPSSSLLAVAFSLQGLRGTPFPGLRGSGCSYHYFASLTHMLPASGNRYDEPFIHLPFACLLLSKFVKSECFKKEPQNGIPQDGNRGGTAATIGSIRDHPPKRRPYFSISALIMVSPRVGWGSLLFPPSLPLRPEGVPLSPLVPGGRCYKAFVHYFRCKDTSHLGLIPIIHFHFHTLGPA